MREIISVKRGKYESKIKIFCGQLPKQIKKNNSSWSTSIYLYNNMSNSICLCRKKDAKKDAKKDTKKGWQKKI